ncbi:MAG: hypothetical protein V1644_02515, partial [Candidatus Micrarchaeota archaeon]
MKFKVAILIIALLVTVSLAGAVANSDLQGKNIDVKEFKKNVPKYIEAYNKNAVKIPPIVTILFGNERINIYVDNALFYGFVTKESRIVTSSEIGVQNPTINIYLSSGTLNDVVNGKIKVTTALQNKLITYKGAGFVDNVKFSILKLAQSVILQILVEESSEEEPEENTAVNSVESIVVNNAVNITSPNTRNENVRNESFVNSTGLLPDLEPSVIYSENWDEDPYDDSINVYAKNNGNVSSPPFSFRVEVANSERTVIENYTFVMETPIRPGYLVPIAGLGWIPNGPSKFNCRYYVSLDILREVNESKEYNNFNFGDAPNCIPAQPDLSIGRFTNNVGSNTFSIEIKNGETAASLRAHALVRTFIRSSSGDFCGKGDFERDIMVPSYGVAIERNRSTNHVFNVLPYMLPYVCRVRSEVTTRVDVN